MREWKWFTIYWQVGATYERRMACTTVMLEHVYPAEPITPRLARLAALAGVKRNHGVWVFSDDDIGYALYPNSHRELERRDLERYTIEVVEEISK